MSVGFAFRLFFFAPKSLPAAGDCRLSVAHSEQQNPTVKIPVWWLVFRAEGAVYRVCRACVKSNGCGAALLQVPEEP